MISRVIKNCDNDLSVDDLKMINNYTRRELSKDEVYTFRVVLCDNDIDRDFECFSIEALDQLKELFIGKSNVFDHNPKTENQTARIYDCYIENVSDTITKTGQPYVRLVAKAYMPKSEKNNEFILSLDSGIQKEVSVGCSVSQSVCSICNKDVKNSYCEHTVGKEYGGKLCYNTLSNVSDAYEWSFVAIPSQRKAGVIKSYINKLEGESVKDIIKSLSLKKEVSFTSIEVERLYDYIKSLETDATYGAIFREDLKSSVVSLAVLNELGIPKNTMLSLVEKMNIDELKSFKKAFEENKSSYLADNPQLSFVNAEEKNIQNIGYKL